jgi:hypothetical protein
MAQKICNTCKELKDYELFDKHPGHSTGRKSQCKACKSLRNKARYQANRDEILAQVKAWRKANPDKVKAISKDWYEANKDRHKANTKGWKKTNSGVAASHTAKRRNAKIQRTPPWLSKEQYAEIEKYYAEAMRLTQTLGELYTVDHIIPLQGKTVSGLHVPWNLQVMKGSENFQKNNKFTIDPE